MVSISAASVYQQTDTRIANFVGKHLQETLPVKMPNKPNVKCATDGYTISMWGFGDKESAERAARAIVEYGDLAETSITTAKGGRTGEYVTVDVTMPTAEFRKLVTNLGIMKGYEAIAQEERALVAEVDSSLKAGKAVLGGLLKDTEVTQIEIQDSPGYAHSATIALSKPITLPGEHGDYPAFDAVSQHNKDVTSRVAEALGIQLKRDGRYDNVEVLATSKGAVTSIRINGKDAVAQFKHKLDDAFVAAQRTDPSSSPVVEGATHVPELLGKVRGYLGVAH